MYQPNFEEEMNYDKFFERHNRRQNKRNKRANNKRRQNTDVSLKLQAIEPETYNQEIAFDEFSKGQNLLLHGVAGTGKTFIALAMALESVLESKLQEKVVLVRSVVPTRDMGFLPGNQKEKSKVYEAPYIDICDKAFKRNDAYELLKQKNKIEFITTSFIRGVTLDNCVIIVDECQNLDFGELDSILTRVGKNSKVVLCGDYRQNDLSRRRGESSGIVDIMKILKTMTQFSSIEFDFSDIVRSGFVRDYIIAKEALEQEQRRLH